MLNRSAFGFALLIAALIFSGCSKPIDQPAAPAAPAAPADQPASEAGEGATTSLNIESETTPEGVTQRFFAAFFSGQDEAAWSLLTAKAQEATRENFSAQASDTIEWKVMNKKLENGIAYVFVEVSDLNDEGDRAKEELIFALRNDDQRWGVAGFSAGELAVDFESKEIGSLDEPEPERVSQTPTENPIK